MSKLHKPRRGDRRSKEKKKKKKTRRKKKKKKKASGISLFYLVFLSLGSSGERAWPLGGHLAVQVGGKPLPDRIFFPIRQAWSLFTLPHGFPFGL